MWLNWVTSMSRPRKGEEVVSRNFCELAWPAEIRQSKTLTCFDNKRRIFLCFWSISDFFYYGQTWNGKMFWQQKENLSLLLKQKWFFLLWPDLKWQKNPFKIVIFFLHLKWEIICYLNSLWQCLSLCFFESLSNIAGGYQLQ